MDFVELSAIDERADQQMISMRDRVRLATDVYLPDAVAGRLPTVLVRTPYDKGADFTFLPRLARVFNERGYAFVAQDVRGKARSEGPQEPFQHEVADGYDTIDWLTRQTWSDGTVGMFGDSYLGFTSLAGAVGGHPGLRAIVPRMMGTERVSGYGPLSLLVVEWAGLYWAGNQHASYEIDWTVRPLSDVILHSAGSNVRAVDQLVAIHQWGPERAKEFMYGTDNPLGAIKIPTLHWTGYWDVLASVTINDYLQLQAGKTHPENHHLRLEAIDHEFYPVGYEGTPPGLGEPIPDDVLDELVPRYTDAALRFFDRHLRGDEVAIPTVEFEVAYSGNETSPQWPPNSSQARLLYFAALARAPAGSGGRLTEVPTTASSVSWIHDPDDPVPNLVGNQWSILAEWPDERAIESREDVLTFTTDPLPEPLRLIGRVHARINLSWEGPGTHIIVKLMDVDETGASRRLLLGARQLSVQSGSESVEIDLGHIGYRVAAGHRLRVQIASSCFPLYAPHPGTSNDPWRAAQVAARTQSLFADRNAGWIELPIC